MLDGHRSTMDLISGNSAEEARERRWESTFFMLNVIFLLILFFIVAANFDVQLQIFPPKSAASNNLANEAIQLTVTQVGALFLNGEAVSPKDLVARVKALGDGREVKLAADARLEAVKVAQIIQELGQAGVGKIAIVTLTRATGEGAEK